MENHLGFNLMPTNSMLTIQGNFKDQKLELGYLDYLWTRSRFNICLFAILYSTAYALFLLVDFTRDYVFDRTVSLSILCFLRFTIFGLGVYIFTIRNHSHFPHRFHLIFPILRSLMSLVILLTVVLSPGSRTLYFTIVGVMICFHLLYVTNIFEVMVNSFVLLWSGILNYKYVADVFTSIQPILYLLFCGILVLSYSVFTWKTRDRKTYFLHLKMRRLIENQKQIFNIFTHDISNPLTVMGFQLSQFMKEVGTASVEERDMRLNKINKQVNHLNAFIESFKNWMTISNREDDIIVRDHFNTQEVINSTLALVQPMASRKGIDIKVEIDSYEIESIRVNIETSIRNIITNAIKFTPQDGSIFLTTLFEHNHLIIEIENTGSQFDVSLLDKVKNRQSLQSGLGTSGELGTGRGLSFCYELLKECGCELFVENKASSVAFRILIPMAVKKKSKIS